MQLENWDDFRAFQALAQAGQLSRAAGLLHVNATTIARRVRRLEIELGVTLFEQTREGHVLTESGQTLLSKVEIMAAAASEIFDRSAGQLEGGQVRLSVSEGFGSWFLARNLPQLTASHPNLTIDLVANSGFLSPSKREADIAVMLSRPVAGPLIARKLSDYYLMLYATPEYLEKAGTPKRPRDLAGAHRLIGYIPDLLYAPELAYLDEFYTGLKATLRSSSINAQHRLLSEGAGIGVLPCFIGDVEPRLTRVLAKQFIKRTFWLVTHKETHTFSNVRLMSSWLLKTVQIDGKVLCPSARPPN